MKLRYIFIAFFLGKSLCSVGQVGSVSQVNQTPEMIFAKALYDTNYAYPKIIGLMDSVISHTSDSAIFVEGGFAEGYSKWKKFMFTHLDNNNSLKGLSLARSKFLPITCNSGSPWSDAGADQISNDTHEQENGPVWSIWAEPNPKDSRRPEYDKAFKPQLIFAGTDGGLWKTTDGGQNWHCMTDNIGYSLVHVNSIAVNPKNYNEIYISTFQDIFFDNICIGIFYSSDGGLTWQRDDNLVSQLTFTKGIAYPDVTVPQTEVAVSPGGMFVCASEDKLWIRNSGTWTEVLDESLYLSGGQPIGDQWNPIDKITFVPAVESPSNPAVLFLSHRYSKIIRVNLVPGNVTATPIALPNASIYARSNVSIPTLNDLYILSETYGPQNANGNIFYSIIFHSHDLNEQTLGNNFTDQQNGLTEFNGGSVDDYGRDHLNNFIASRSLNSNGVPVFYFSGLNFYKSIDGGATYQTITIQHVDHRDMTLSSSSTLYQNGAYDVIVAANDGGVACKRPDVENTGLENFNNNGLSISAFPTIASSEHDATFIAGGQTHDGTDALINGSWKNIGGGDDAGTLCDDYIGINASNSNNIIVQNDELGNFKKLGYSPDFGLGGSNNLDALEFSSADITNSTVAVINSEENKPIKLATNGSDIYVGYDEILKITHAGTSLVKNPLAVTNILSSFPDLTQGAVFDPNYNIIAQTTHYPIKSFDVGRDPSGEEIFYCIYDVTYWGDCAFSNRLVKWNSGTQTATNCFNITISTPCHTPNSQNLYLPQWLSPSYVVVNPANANEVWLAFSGYSVDNTGALQDGLQRVMYSNDAGATWEDRSAGLPDIPVNVLAYRKGSNDEIYLGNEIGVWVWKPAYAANAHTNAACPAAGQWVCFSNNLPNASVLDIKINSCGQRIRCSFDGHGVWESELPPLSNPTESFGTGQPLSLADFETQYGNSSTPYYIDHSIQLYGPGQATLTGVTLNFNKGYNLIVGTGVKLTLKDCILQSACQCSWGGVIVNGQTTQNQNQDANGIPYNQGFVSLLNTTIRNAYGAAVSASDPTQNDGGGGGIIQAEKSTFENNRRGIEFMQYPTLSSLPQTNKSYFSLCTFHNTKPLTDNMTFTSFITMWSVSGVKINGCNFDNQTGFTTQFTTGNTYSSKNLGNGILTIDANFLVDRAIGIGGGPGITLTETKSNFDNLNYGIWASNASTLNSISIRNSTFSYNRQGAALYSECLGTVIQYNTFDYLGEYPFNNIFSLAYQGTLGISNGLILNGTSGFNFEQNCFNAASNPISSFTNGAWFYQTSIFGNTSKSNNFYNLPYAQYAQGDNRGLQFWSNTHVGSTFDITTFNQYPPSALPLSGIIPNSAVNSQQGKYLFLAHYQSAGNIFSSSASYNFYNYCPPTVTYYAPPILTSLEYPSVIYNVVRSGSGNYQSSPYPLFDCSADPDPPIVIYTPWKVGAVKYPLASGTAIDISNIFSAAKILHTSSVNSHKSLIDGGSTSYDLNQIAAATSANVSDLRYDLLAQSPYLSETVGTALANASSIFPSAYLFEVLAANPDILRDNSIINIITSSKPQILSDSLVSILQSLQDSATDRTLLESTISSSSQDMHTAVKLLCTDIFLDSTGINHAALISWLDSLEEPEADMMIVDDLMGSKNYSQAQALIDSMPSKYTLDSFQVASLASYTGLITYFSNLSSNHIRLDSILTKYSNSPPINPWQAYSYPSGSGGGPGTSSTADTGQFSLALPYVHQCRVDSAFSVNYPVHDLYLNLHYLGTSGSTFTFSASGKQVVRQTQNLISGPYSPIHVEVLDSPSTAWAYTVVATVSDSLHGSHSINIPIDSISMNTIPALGNCDVSYDFWVDSIVGHDPAGHVINHFKGTVVNAGNTPVYMLLMPQDSIVMHGINCSRVRIAPNNIPTYISGTFLQPDTLPRDLDFLVAVSDSLVDSVCIAEVIISNIIQPGTTSEQSNGSNQSGWGGGNWTSMDSTAMDSLNSATPIYGNIQLIADYGTGPAAARARNFLRFFYHEAYEDLPSYPGDTTRRERRSLAALKLKQTYKSNAIKVYPNPANDLVTLEYQLSDASDFATVIIINQIGQQMYSGSLPAGQGDKTVSIRSWSPGLYLYKINSQQGFEASGSFIVNH